MKTLPPRAPEPAGSCYYSYDRAPFLIYWEATRACDLACVHCRAEAVRCPHPFEMRTEQVRSLFRQILEFGGPRWPHVVITGGAPLKRSDLFDLIKYGVDLGLSLSITPAGTPLLDAAMVWRLKEAGISSMALSLDGSTPALHDAFRGVPGSFRWTLEAARAAVAAKLPLQINTLVSAQTIGDIPRIHDQIASLGIVRWALFFLIATGRGRRLSEASPVEAEKLMRWLWRVASEAPFSIKTTEAHHYRRIAVRAMRSRGMRDDEIAATPEGRGFGVRDANGILFISHTGEVCPSGFLPMSGGNIQLERLVDIYRESPLFRSLRVAAALKGKCGACEYREICGGSRARAYAATGDPLESDPLCPYHPGEKGCESLDPAPTD